MISRSAKLVAMIKYLIGILVLLTFSTGLHAQQLYTITGVVQDKKGETLPGAGIYLSGYTTATVTDNDGKFVLAKLKPGSYEVVVQMIGYLPYSKSVVISDQTVNIKVVLQENTVQLREVVITADPNRERHLQMFREFFIGRTPNSAKCKILNPEVLYTKFDGDHRVLSVTSNEFLVVENKALGYRLKYMLNLFEYNMDSRIVYFSGLPVFEDLKGSGGKRKTWLKNREVAYAGSPQHFFQALYRNKVQEEGFIIYKRITVPNPNRPSDAYLAEARARVLRRRKIAAVSATMITDSLNILQRLADMPKAYTSLDMRGVIADTLARQIHPNLMTMNYSDDLYILYTKEEESVPYSNSGHYILRPLTVPNYQISVVKMLQGPVSFYANGGMHDAKSLLYEGFWAYEKVGDMVPMDYIPVGKR